MDRLYTEAPFYFFRCTNLSYVHKKDCDGNTYQYPPKKAIVFDTPSTKLSKSEVYSIASKIKLR